MMIILEIVAFFFTGLFFLGELFIVIEDKF